MTDPAAPRALLLDVMSTLVHEPFVADLPAHFSLSLEQLKAAVSGDAWVAFEHGDIDEAEFATRFFVDGRRYDYDAMVALLRGSYAFLDGIEALLTDLKAAGVPMYALSNYPRWYLLIEDELALSRFVDWRFVSCETGVRKPDPRAYTGAADALHLEPQQCLFVDDREGNCAAARQVGMPAVRFQGADALRSELETRGLLVRKPSADA